MVLQQYANYLKINFPNVYIVVISGLITMWFRSFADVAYYYIPEGGIKMKWIVLSVITALLYFGDNSLDELYKFDHKAAVSTVNDEDQNRNTKNTKTQHVRR